MTRVELSKKYDEFFGTGIWERDYKHHIIVFTEQCLLYAGSNQDQGKIIPPKFESLDFKKMRREKLLTLKNVEDKTGFSPAYLSLLENGKIPNPRYDVVQTLLEIYYQES